MKQLCLSFNRDIANIVEEEKWLILERRKVKSNNINVTLPVNITIILLYSSDNV